MNPKLIILVLMISALLVACNMPAPATDNVPGGPEAWIDAPLPDSHLPLAPYSVIAHADSPNGIAWFELSVNGQVYNTEAVDPAQAGQTLVNQTQPWIPTAPGTYLLSVRALDNKGSWGPSTEAQVTVGDTNNLPTVPAPPTPPNAPAVQPTTVRPTAAPPIDVPPPPATDVPPSPRPTAMPPTEVPLPQDTRGPAIGAPNAQPNPNGLPRSCRSVPPTVVTVRVIDPSGVGEVDLHVTYRGVEQVISMSGPGRADNYSGNWDVPQDADGGEATFFIEASDTLGNVSIGGRGTISISRTVCP